MGLIVLCGTAVQSFPQAIDLADPPQGVFLDEWFLVELAGGKIGYMHSTFTRQGDVVSTTQFQTFTIGRADVEITVSQRSHSEETLDGKPRSFATEMQAATQTVRVRGEVKDGKVEVVTQQYGPPRAETFDYPAGAVMSWGALLVQHNKGLAPGTEYEIDLYVPDVATNIALKASVKMGEKEMIDLLGEHREAIRSEQTLRLPQFPTGITTTAWLDGDGNVLRQSIPMMGLEIVATRCTREQALAANEPPEFFVPTLVGVDRRIDASSARSIHYRLRLEGPGGDMPALPETGMQKPGPVAGGAAELTVTRQDHSKLAAEPGAAPPDDLARYLSSNTYINTDDEAVKAMAAEAAGDATDPLAVAVRLRRYVGRTITDKNLNVGFATASEVCRNREGDCSEHGVLLAALGRARGIPSRVAVGLMYVPEFAGKQNVYGFHMWTQFHINGRWVDFDALIEDDECDPTHIAVRTTPLDDAGLFDVAFSILEVIGRLKIEIVNVDPADAAESGK